MLRLYPSSKLLLRDSHADVRIKEINPLAVEKEKFIPGLNF
jgi:hypothetical protein